MSGRRGARVRQEIAQAALAVEQLEIALEPIRGHERTESLVENGDRLIGRPAFQREPHFFHPDAFVIGKRAAVGLDFAIGGGELAVVDEVADVTLVEFGVLRELGDPGTVLVHDSGFRQPLIFGQFDGPIEGRGCGDEVEGCEFLRGLQTAMVVIGEGNAVVGERGVGFPIGLGGGEIERQFGFAGSQTIEGCVLG